MSSKLPYLVLAVCLSVIATKPNVFAQRVYEESNGFVAIEMENTKSPLGQSVFLDHAAAANGNAYPSGAVGTGHLEYQGPFTNPTPGSSLDYFFKINQTGSYELRLRAHRRLLGASSDSNNDAFVKLAGKFTSGNPNVPFAALVNNTKLFGGAPEDWGFARKLDGNGAHLEDVIYNLQAGKPINCRSLAVQQDSTSTESS